MFEKAIGVLAAVSGKSLEKETKYGVLTKLFKSRLASEKLPFFIPSKKTPNSCGLISELNETFF